MGQTRDPAADAQLVVQALPELAVIVFDHELRYLSAVGRGLAALGLAAETMVGRTVFEALPLEVSAALVPGYRAALAGRDTSVDVVRDGQVWQSRCAAVRDGAGVVVAGVSVAQDVTGARERETAGRAREERLRLAFDQAPSGRAVITPDGRFERVNPALCQLTGYTEHQLCELTVADLAHPDDAAAQVIAMLGLVTGELTTHRADTRLRSASGVVVWVCVSAALVRRADGSILHVMAEFQDITQSKAQEYSLSEERRRLTESQSIGGSGYWEVDLATDAVTWSDSLFEIYGLSRGQIGADYGSALECVHPDDRALVDEAMHACATAGTSMRAHYRVIRRSDGALRWIDARGEAIYEHGRLVRVVGAVADVTRVTQQVLAQAEAASANAFQHAVINSSPDVIYVHDVAAAATVWTNRSLTDLLGYPPEQVPALGADVVKGLMPQDDHLGFEAARLTAVTAADDDVALLDHRLRQADGTIRWFTQRLTPLHRDEQGHVTQLIGVLRDVTDAMALQQGLEHVALHDHLTGLPNRALLVDRLGSALARSERDRREIAVLFCDLDGFKRVNDTAGHAAGDAVLVETAERLQSVLRPGDTVARVGGDEFVMVVEPWNRADPQNGTVGHHPASDREVATKVAQRVAQVMRAPIVVNGVEHVVTTSIGITHGRLSGTDDTGGVTADEILQDADAAMYRAKDLGRDRFEIFEGAIRQQLAERGHVERQLRSALRATGRGAVPVQGGPHFGAVYQPIVDASSGALVGFEALARLTDSDGVQIPPEVFISVAEDTGIIRSLGALMLELACGQLAAWRARTPSLRAATMAVNVSALQAPHSYLVDDVRRTLTAHGLAPSDLVLELTETALLHAANSTIANLRALHDEGVGIAIDDFGIGYASLRYLATLPITALKVDRSFTSGLPSDETSQKIIKAVAGLAADMNLDCIVEGVETQAQRAALPDGVQLQGWLTGRPQRPEALDLRELSLHP